MTGPIAGLKRQSRGKRRPGPRDAAGVHHIPLPTIRDDRETSPRKLSSRGVSISLPHHHMSLMTQWQITLKREPAKTKAELREMLTEAVRNTQAEPKPKSKSIKDD